jgi:hypothetical protein
MNQDSIQKVYDEIGQLQIELEADPTILGPGYINQMTAQCRNHLNRVTLIRLRISREKRALKSQLSGEETLHAAERDRLLAEDETVRKQPNLRDREAVANTIQREKLNVIAGLKNELLDLDTVEKAVVLVHEELIRTSNEIKTQRSLLLADRFSGAGYGDEYDGPRDEKGRPLPKESSIDESELDRIMAGGDPPRVQVESDVSVVEVELPPELIQVVTPVIADTVIPKVETARVEPATSSTVTNKDPSVGLTEDPGVLIFLETKEEVKVPETKMKPLGDSSVSDDEDYFAGILQNL